jgi:multiple sugar transport system ATP-binding protein
LGSLGLRNIHMSFGNNPVLKNIDLDFDDGDFVIFVGPSGCGKSTLLRIIAGLEDPDQGEVLISGQTVTGLPASKRKIAMVFQTYALYPHLTVEKNMSLGLRQAGEAADYIDRRVTLAVEMLQLEPYLKRKPAELSGGQRQRVAIGRAIVRNPELFLFDEPLSNLDAALRVSMRLEIARLHRELKSTIVYVTHDQIEAMTLAQKIVVLRDGCIEQVGSPMQLYKDPDNMFVAGFIGSPAMNFIEAGHFGTGGNATTIGVRPECLELSRRGRFAGTVSHLEHLGAETNIFINTAGGLITVRQFGDVSYDIGAKVNLNFKDDDLLFFDKNGDRLR